MFWKHVRVDCFDRYLPNRKTNVNNTRNTKKNQMIF